MVVVAEGVAKTSGKTTEEIMKEASGGDMFRISEKTLIILALLGGALAEYTTMRFIRHKTIYCIKLHKIKGR